MLFPQVSLTDMLLGSPVFGLLALTYFRLAEMLGRPAPRPTLGRPLSHRDEAGRVVCIEPDGRYLCPEAAVSCSFRNLRQPGHLPRRNRIPSSTRISVFWQQDGEE